MKSIVKPLVLAALLASAGMAAYSQAPAGGMMGAGGPMMHEGMGHQRMGHMNPERMQAWVDKRLAALKAALKLTPAQEGAWATYTAAMKPPVDRMKSRHAQREEIAKLPTPERIDKMKALRTEHMGEMSAAMDKRGEATKAFYATLTPEQQKTFDAQALRLHRDGGWRGGPREDRAQAPAKS